MLPVLQPHQLEDFKTLLENKKHGNLSDPGSGKTPTANRFAEYVWYAEGLKTIMVMPTDLFEQNHESFLTFTGFTEEEVRIVEGPPKKRQKIYDDPQVKVYIASFDWFKNEWPYLKSHPLFKDQRFYCIVDEYHLGYIGPTSDRTQAWLGFCHYKADRALVMTGTIISGGLSSAYAFINMVEPRYYFSYSHFLDQHAVMNEYDKPEAWVGVERVQAILQRHGIRRTFESIYGEPKKKIQTILLPMSEKHRQVYEAYDAAATIALMLEAQKLGIVTTQQQWMKLNTTMANVSTNPAVQALRARQILAAPETLGLHIEPLQRDLYVVAKAWQLHQEGKSFVVFGSMVEEVERIARLLNSYGIPTEYIHGSRSKKLRRAADRKFKRKEVAGMVATPKTCSVGFNWPFVAWIGFVSTDHLDSSFTQGVFRALRGVREDYVDVECILYQDSCDIWSWLIVDKKSELASKVDGREQLKLSATKRVKVEPKTPSFVVGKNLGFSNVRN